MTRISLDYETSSPVPIDRGLDLYLNHPQARVLLCAYHIDDEPIRLWDYACDGPFPRRVARLLADPAVIKTAFNAAFERLVTRDILKIDTPYEGWRCSMALAYSQSFVGTLGDVGEQMGMPADQQKDKRGKRLVRLFTMPQKPTKNQPHVWCTHETHPVEWDEFREYCRQDVAAEDAIRDWLMRYPLGPGEWSLYELDQRINDAGLPVDADFCEAAMALDRTRKDQLRQDARELTGLDNAGSGKQLGPWLRARGYPYEDIKADSVVKVLRECAGLTDDAREALMLHQSSSKSSTAKYAAALSRVGPDGRLRHLFQFNGASRTGRWAGRGKFQPQNLPRTPKALEDAEAMDAAIAAIKALDLDTLEVMVGEPMVALVGCIRSAVAAPAGYELRVCDLASIESRVLGWLAGCTPLLDIFNQGQDPYKFFATRMFDVEYDQVSKKQRNIAKAPTLGCGFSLGAGEEKKDGTKTGLLSYAERMGVFMTAAEAKHAVKVFRTEFAEVPLFWRALGDGAEACLRTGRPQTAGKWLTFHYEPPYLRLALPSGRSIHYFEPDMVKVWFAKHPKRGVTRVLGADEPRARRAEAKGWEVYHRPNLRYWGKQQNGPNWVQIITHPGKGCENAVQAIARDILKSGLLNAAAAGFNIVGSVHDEIIVLERMTDQAHSLEALRQAMIAPIAWAPGLPLDAAGWTGRHYRKD